MPVIDELQALDLQLAGLHQNAPYAIQGVSQSQFSVARHYGGIRYQGEHYTYFAEVDELVRDDVLAYVRKAAKVRAKLDKEIEKQECAKAKKLQGELIGQCPERIGE